MTNYKLENPNWILQIQEDDHKYKYELKSKITKETYADEDYHYRLLKSSKKGSRFAYLFGANSEYNAKGLVSRKIKKENDEILIIEGQFEDTDIYLIQKFVLKKESKWLDEYITLINKGNRKSSKREWSFH